VRWLSGLVALRLLKLACSESVPMTTRKQLTLHLDDTTARALDHEAKLRGLTLSSAANDALKRVLI
jgi:hypothetical protein